MAALAEVHKQGEHIRAGRYTGIYIGAGMARTVPEC